MVSLTFIEDLDVWSLDRAEIERRNTLRLFWNKTYTIMNTSTQSKPLIIPLTLP